MTHEANYTDMAQERAGGLRLIRKVLVVLCCVVALNAFVTAMQFVRLSQEGQARRDQICRQAELADRKEVASLRRTYDYLGGLSPAERRAGINSTLLRLLPQTEDTARSRQAPAFCSEPNVGLPDAGPGPVELPDRPASLPR